MPDAFVRVAIQGDDQSAQALSALTLAIQHWRLWLATHFSGMRYETVLFCER